MLLKLYLYLILNIASFTYYMIYGIIDKLINIFFLVFIEKDSVFWDHLESINFLVACLFLNSVSLVGFWYFIGIFSYQEIYEITDRLISAMVSAFSQLPREAVDSASASLNSGVSPDFNNPTLEGFNIEEKIVDDEEEQSEEELLKGPQYNASTYIMFGLTCVTLSVLILFLSR
jgi:hypothetical protein